MDNPMIEEFARRLVVVRDRAVRDVRVGLLPSSAAPAAARLRELTKEGIETKPLLDALVPEMVDVAIAHVLNAIDQGEMHLLYRSENGESVDLDEEGFSELAGWYGTWLEKYAKEPFIKF